MRSFFGIDDEDGVGKTVHVFDAAEEALELVHLVLELRDFFLGQAIEVALRLHAFEFAQTRDALLDGREVGERAAQPALVDEIGARALGFFANDFLRLLLGADEENDALLTSHLLDGFVGLAQLLHGEREIDDVDAVALLEDERLHLGVPAAGLMPEVDAGLEEFAHGNN